jgi:hypothetical protein
MARPLGEEGNAGSWSARPNLRRERWPGTPVLGRRGPADYQFTKLNDAGAPKLQQWTPDGTNVIGMIRFLAMVCLGGIDGPDRAVAASGLDHRRRIRDRRLYRSDVLMPVACHREPLSLA